MSGYRIELLGTHDRSAFACGSEPLDRYFRERATQDMRRRMAYCFVAVDASDAIAGFYTLAATSLVIDLLPPEQAKRLPRYPSVPAALLGRLAVSLDAHGRGLGGALVADALLRAGSTDLAAYAMVVDAKDDAAVRFYMHLGFTPLAEAPRRLIRRL